MGTSPDYLRSPSGSELTTSLNDVNTSCGKVGGPFIANGRERMWDLTEMLG